MAPLAASAGAQATLVTETARRSRPNRGAHGDSGDGLAIGPMRVALRRPVDRIGDQA